MSATIMQIRQAFPRLNSVVKNVLIALSLLTALVPANAQGPDASKLIGGNTHIFAGSTDPNASVAYDGNLASASALPGASYTVLDANGNLYFSYLSGVSVIYGGNSVPPILAVRAAHESFTPQNGFQYRIAGYTDSASVPPCQPPSACGDGGPALANLGGGENPLINAVGITVDGAGNLYIVDEVEQSVRKVSASDGTISTIVGDPMHSASGYNGDGRLASTALLSYPNAAKFDSSGNLYIADAGNYLIRRVDTSGMITTIAGNVSAAVAANGNGFPPGCDASTDNCGEGGTPLNATLGYIFGMSFDVSGNLFLAELSTHVVREINLSASSPTIHTIAGTLRMPCSPPASPAPPQCGDTGLATSALLNGPSDVVADGFGNVAIADQTDNAVRLVTVNDGKIQTIAGQIASAIVSGGDTGPATSSNISLPTGLLLDLSGNLYISDPYTNTATNYSTSVIRQVTPPPTYTISFPAIAPATYGVGTISLSATVNETGSPVASYTVVSGPGTITGSILTVTGAGTITVEADQPGDSNYAAATPVTQTVTIAPAVLTVTATNLSRSPGTDNPPLTYTITGFVNGDTASVITGAPVLTTTATISSPFGFYPITVGLGTLLANSNYTLTTVNGILSVSEALPQTITFAAIPNVTYGASALTLSATASPSSLPVTLTATGPAKISGVTLVITGAGTVAVTANQAGNLTYAAAAPVTQTFTVAPAPITITPVSVSRPYNTANPIFTYTATGLVGGDTTAVLSGGPIYSTTATSTSDVGAYPITVIQGNLFSQNYNFVFGTGTLTVTQAAQTIVVGDVKDVLYGQNETIAATASSGLPISFTTTGPISNISLSSSIVVTAIDIGPVTVTATQPGSMNYAPAASVTVSFNAVRSPLNVYVRSASRPVGAANPPLVYALQTTDIQDPVAPPYVTGVAELTTTATETSPPGTYPIVATQGTLTAEHYYFVFNNATLTVTSASSYIITTTPTSLTVPRGSTRQLTVTVSEVNNYTGSITMGCGSLPVGVTCSFSPATLFIPLPDLGSTGAMPVQGTLTITANGNISSVAPHNVFGGGKTLTAGFLFLPAGLGGLVLLLGRRRLLKNAHLRNGLMLVMLVCALSALTACGGGTTGAANAAVTGTTTIQITGTATPSDGATDLNQTTSLSLTVQ